MAPYDDELTDDYVVSLLKRDAERLSTRARHSALASRARPTNGPRTNTRFLQHTIRDLDSHNTALKIREKTESRARLQKLEAGRDDSIACSPQVGPIEEKSQCNTRRSSTDALQQGRKRYKVGHVSGSSRDTWSRHKNSQAPSRSPQRKESARKYLQVSHTRTHEKSDGILASRHASSSPTKSRPRSRSRPTSRSDLSHAPCHTDERRSQHVKSNPSRVQRETESSFRQDHTYQSDVSNDDDTSFGPSPPPRGRGASKAEDDGMNSRSRPTHDSQLSLPRNRQDGGDDWYLSLEALRARAQWRADGASGFTSPGVTVRSLSCEDRDASSLRWTKEGEPRDWDRGKVEDAGRIDVRAKWVVGHISRETVSRDY